MKVVVALLVWFWNLEMLVVGVTGGLARQVESVVEFVHPQDPVAT